MTSQLSNISTESENKKLEELFLAVYFNDLEKVIEFKNQFPKLYAKKDKFVVGENINFDLTNLTFFNHVIWFDGNWIDSIKPLAEKHRKRTEQMLGFWRAEFGRQEIRRQIEYNNYCDFFYCDDPNDPEDNEEIILDPVSYFLENGFREIDVRLYNRIECFDFMEAKKLLEQGAKINIHFYNDGDSSAFTRISHEVSFLTTCEVIPEFEVFETKGYNQNFDTTRMFGDILGLAAHEEMYHLLEKYNEVE
jgi:hypothetical protein